VKEYFPHDFRKLALETLDKVAETEPERIAINRQGDKLIDITVYERAPGERRCYSRRKTRVFYIQWSGFAMESIQISPPYDCHIPCLTEDGTPREIKEIVEDVKKVDKYKIGVTVRILKKLSRSEVVASLLGKVFLVEMPHRISELKADYYFFLVSDDIFPTLPKGYFYELDGEEALLYLL